MADKVFFVFILCCCFTVVITSGTYCTKYNSYSFDETIYCSTSCCGTNYNRYCCDRPVSDVGVTVLIIFGVLGLVAIVVTVLVVVCCCCRKSRGQTGHVCQPAGVVTAQVYGVQTTVIGYGQTGYTDAAFPQQLPATNVPGNGGENWQLPPPPYSAVNVS